MRTIRTSIRRTLHWVVNTPENFRRTVIGAFAVLIAFTAWSMISPYLRSAPAARPAAASPAAPPSESAPPTPAWMPTLTPTASGSPPGGEPAVPDVAREVRAVEAATRFVVVWLEARTTSRPTWVTQASALTTGEATAMIQATVPQLVPSALVVRGELVSLTAVDAAVNVTITNGETLTIELDALAGWKVTMYGPEAAG
ncbi:MAG: hypothetical protein ACRCY8_09915 [Dermatophilaceae bacterium]